MKFHTLENFNFNGKRVLLRIDINSEISNRKVILGERIPEHAKTIRELQKKGAKITILAHQSSPGKSDFTSLKQHAKLLNKFTKVKFVDDILGKKAVSEIIFLKKGEALLLENVRSLEEEFSPSTKNDLVKILAPLHDIYINDAFSVSHRAQTSVVSFPHVLKSGIGRTMEKEISALEKINEMKNCLYILGGAKADVNLYLLKKSKNVLVGGIFGHLCLIASGKNLGAQNRVVKDQFKYLKEIKKYLRNCTLPLDLAVKQNGKRKTLNIEEFPSQNEVFDIGEKTTSLFVKKIKSANCILMKGTVGFCEEKQFSKGTFSLLKAISNSKAFSVIGGGHLTTALKKSKISKNKFSYVSLSGGAMEEFLAGNSLPGLEALKK